MDSRLQANDSEAEALLTVCMLAALADGSQSEVERDAIERLAAELPNRGADHGALYHRVLLGQISSAQAAQRLDRAELRQLAYEMAVCVCEVDNLLTPREKSFLQQLSQVLGLDANDALRIEKGVEALAFPNFADAPSALAANAPPAALPSGKSDDIDGMIMNYAILNGALELMPQSLATMAIIPLQMKMVYRIGKKFGYELDRGHIKELLAAEGIGLSAQVFEGYATKLFGGLFGKIAGKLGRSVANQAASSALSFATTYAIGHMAQNYYAGGRTLSGAELRQLFEQAKEKARSLHGQYLGQIQLQSQNLDMSRILGAVRGQN